MPSAVSWPPSMLTSEAQLFRPSVSLVRRWQAVGSLNAADEPVAGQTGGLVHGSCSGPVSHMRGSSHMMSMDSMLAGMRRSRDQTP